MQCIPKHSSMAIWFFYNYRVNTNTAHCLTGRRASQVYDFGNLAERVFFGGGGGGEKDRSMGDRRHRQGSTCPGNVVVCCALAVTVKRSVDELFMHYFHNFSPAPPVLAGFEGDD